MDLKKGNTLGGNLKKDKNPGIKEYTKKNNDALNEWRKNYTKEKHPNWRGGITPLNKTIRYCSAGYRWTLGVLKKDNYTCQNCGKKGCYLEAHHIVSISEMIRKYNIKTLEEALTYKEFWDLENGIALCKNCHSKTDNYKGKSNKK